jgi:uncharacterized membrane-anchored protein
MKRVPTLVLVAAPLVVMGGWIFLLSLALARGTQVTLPIRGYDPRDLLRGHYLQYTVDYGLQSNIKGLPAYSEMVSRAASDFCVCLHRDSSGLAVGTWVGPCKERDAAGCPLFIRGEIIPRWEAGENQENWSLKAGIERFYIPDRYQQELSTIPEGAKIQVQVTKDGRAFVTEMTVEGKPLLEHIRPK